MADLPEPPPEQMLYLLDGVDLAKLLEVADGLAKVVEMHQLHPHLMAPEVATVLTASRNQIVATVANFYIHHDPRWALEDGQ